MNPQMVAQQQRYLQAQHQAQFQAQHPQQRPHPQHPQQIPHGHPGQHGHPAQHMQHMQHPQHPQHLQQRRPVGATQQRPRTAQQQGIDPAAYMNELQARHERSLAAAKRPTDQTISDSLDDLVLGDGVIQYKRMRDIERRLDAMMMRKMISIEQEIEVEEEGGTANPFTSATRRQYQTMRIWICNTAENQPWQGTSSLEENPFDFDNGSEPRYRVKIVGKIIDSDPSEDNLSNEGQVPVNGDIEAVYDDLDIDSEYESDVDAMDKEPSDNQIKSEEDKEGDGDKAKLNKNKPEVQISKLLEKLQKRSPPLKLSNCFEKITVEFEKSTTLRTDITQPVEWKRPANWNSETPPQDSDFDTLEFERKSDQTLQCTINLHRQSHGLFKLSDSLADLLQIKEASRNEVIQALWQYIRISRVPQEEDKGMVQCDDALRKVFGTDFLQLKGRFHEVLAHHLQPLPPHSLHYTIRVDSEFQTNPTPTIYDVPVPVAPGTVSQPSLARVALASLVHSPIAKLTTGTITQRDQAQAQAVAALQDSRARHAFFASMAADPARFVRRWLSSQRRDLEIILGDARFGNPDAEATDWERWMADEFRKGGNEGVWGSEGVRESVELMVRQQRG